MSDERWDDDALDAAWRALPTREPPADFVDRVLAAHSAPSPPRRPRWVLLAAAAVLLLGVGGGVFVALRDPDPPGGELSAEVRQTVTLGTFGRAVAEPGARLRWRDAGDGLRVDQAAGAVFYRADRGPLTVHTAAGVVTTDGGCLTVEIEPMNRTLRGAALGAVLGAGLVVTVYEGEAALSGPEGEVVVPAGETGRAGVEGAAPTRAPRAPRATAPTPLPPLGADAAEPPTEAIAVAVEDARPTEAGPDEVARLRARIEALEGELADERAMRLESEGEPIPMPPDLPAQFQKDALLANMQRAIDELGVDGEVTSVDCTEFPCIIYGDIDHTDEEVFDKLRGTAAMQPYTDAASGVSAWGHEQETPEGRQKRAFFGVALYPRGEAPEARTAVGRRMRFRNQQAFEAMAPKPENSP